MVVIESGPVVQVWSQSRGDRLDICMIGCARTISSHSMTIFFQILYDATSLDYLVRRTKGASENSNTQRQPFLVSEGKYCFCRLHTNKCNVVSNGSDGFNC